MMNKLTALFAMIIGLAVVVPTVDAAKPARGAAAKAAKAKAEKAAEDKKGEDKAKDGDKKAEDKKGEDKAKDGDKKAEDKKDGKENEEPGFFARRKQNLVDAQGWAVEHKVAAGAITVGTVAAIVVIAEAAKNGKNSWLPRAYRAMLGKSEQHNRLADVMKAKQAAQAA